MRGWCGETVANTRDLKKLLVAALSLSFLFLCVVYLCCVYCPTTASLRTCDEDGTVFQQQLNKVRTYFKQLDIVYPSVNTFPPPYANRQKLAHQKIPKVVGQTTQFSMIVLDICLSSCLTFRHADRGSAVCGVVAATHSKV